MHWHEGQHREDAFAPSDLFCSGVVRGATMTNPNSGHLTEDQFAEFLMDGNIDPQLQEHIAMCEACREELNIFSSAVGDFGSASLRWMEARPVSSLRQAARDNAQRNSYIQRGWALAAAAAVLVAVPVWMYGHRDLPVNDNSVAAIQPAANQTQAENSEAQIAQDNELLKSVDVALSETAPSPFREFGISPEGAHRGRVRSESRNE